MSTDSAILNRLVKNMKSREADPLRPMIDQYVLERDAADNRLTHYEIDMRPRLRPGGRLSPSAVGGCKRKMVFQFLGVKGRRKLDPDTEMLFEDGNWRHHKWQAIFLDMEEVLGADRFRVLDIEKKVVDEAIYLMGYVDAIVMINGVTYIIDFKGINERGWAWITNGDAAKQENKLQVIAYEALADETHGILLYDNKNNSATRGFAVEFTEADWRDAKEWVDEVLGRLEDRRLPSKHPNCRAGSFQYEKCPFAKLCYGEKTVTQVRKRVYRNFHGLDAAWEEGNRAIEQAEAQAAA